MRRIGITMMLALLCQSGWAATVWNVRASQRPETQNVDIYYDLAAAIPAYVAVAVSTNDGANYDVPAATLTSAPGTTSVGSGVVAGVDRHIIWNAGVDWSNRFSSVVRVQVTAYDGAGPAPTGMALIPAGSFQMGDGFGEGESRELPVHSVYVSAFYMDRTEVTKALWDEVRAWGLNNGYTDLPGRSGKASNHPVHTIDWYAMVKWCNARSQKEGRTPAYYTSATQTTIYKTGSVVVQNDWVKWTAAGYRLPTEAEWEKAARGGSSGRRFPWSDSDTIQHARANYYSSTYSYDTSPTRGYHPDYDDTSPVGSFAPNGYGLYDMAGNLWEWCWDWYGSYPSGGVTDPRGPASGSRRVLRGGSWEYRARGCRVAFRYSYRYPAYAYYAVGFRAVLPPGQ